MVITTVTLSPAVDRTYYVNDLNIDGLNRAWLVKSNAGGKGVNFSNAIAACSLKCVATGFLGDGGAVVEGSMKERGIETEFIKTGGETRVNVKICDSEKKTYTEINECGNDISEAEAKRLFDRLAELTQRSTYLYMGGTLPPGMPDDTYCKMIELGKKRGAITILDTSGAALLQGLEAKPHIIKPNRVEMETLLGRRIKSFNDAADATREIAAQGIDTVLLSLGGDGAVAANANAAYRVLPLHVPVKSTVGAGDCFLAGYVYAKTRNFGMEAALKYAMSFAAAKIQKEGTDMPDFEEMAKNTGNIVCDRL